MRRWHLHAMHEFEVIVAQGWTRLGEQQYVAISQTGHGNAVTPGKEVAGGLAILVCHFCIFLW